MSVEHTIAVAAAGASPTAGWTPPVTSTGDPGGSRDNPSDDGLAQVALMGLLPGLLAVAYRIRLRDQECGLRR